MAFPKTSCDDIERTFNKIQFEGVFMDFADSNKLKTVKEILRNNFKSVRTIKLGSKTMKADQRVCFLVPTAELTDEKFDLLDTIE